MICGVHDRGRQRYLPRTRPPTRRVLRRRLLQDPDAIGQRNLRVGEPAGPDLSEHSRKLGLNLEDSVRRYGKLQPGLGAIGGVQVAWWLGQRDRDGPTGRVNARL